MEAAKEWNEISEVFNFEFGILKYLEVWPLSSSDLLNLDCGAESVNGLKLCGLNVLRKGDQLHRAGWKVLMMFFTMIHLTILTDSETGSENLPRRLILIIHISPQLINTTAIIINRGWGLHRNYTGTWFCTDKPSWSVLFTSLNGKLLWHLLFI